MLTLSPSCTILNTRHSAPKSSGWAKARSEGPTLARDWIKTLMGVDETTNSQSEMKERLGQVLSEMTLLYNNL